MTKFLTIVALTLLITGLGLGTKLGQRALTPTANEKALVKTVTDVVINTSTVTKTNTIKLTAKRIKKLNLSSDRVVLIVGEIGENVVGITQQINALSKASNDPIYLIIDSPGGSVFRGALVISAMEASNAPIYTICYNLCASMAAVIHQYGDKRYSVDRSILMFHPAAGMYMGDIDRIHSFSDFASRYVDKIDVVIAARAGVSLETFKTLAAKELWIDAEDALELHLTDGLVDISFRDNAFENQVTEKAKQGGYYKNLLYRVK